MHRRTSSDEPQAGERSTAADRAPAVDGRPRQATLQTASEPPSQMAAMPRAKVVPRRSADRRQLARA